jgi:anti-sigma factor RsiW
MAARPLMCRDLVELVTDYLDGALAPATHAAVDQHLRGCPGCTEYVNQIRATTRHLGALPPQPLDPQVCDRLRVAFRGWAATADGGT